MRGENPNIAMEDDPAEQGTRGERDQQPPAGDDTRARAHGQRGGERGTHLRTEERDEVEEGRQSDR